MKKVQVIASGKVQGVGFRMYTQTKAEELGIVGFVQNLIDGTVQIVAAGKDAKVDALIDWAKYGSPPAKVDDLQIEVMKYQAGEFDRFEIRRFRPNQ
ncbi:acylphosphatase [Waterburya agarophytonicola K14]|uniref:acylphosphatase n=1 Tax=Waterburya agarophytonicola KI4 TaxID=2874699 RepID=A0A964FE93_9CYAN|nr:acylphosphatase [Waterburya agarophytonicola KI4]